MKKTVAPLTIILIGLSVLVSLLSKMGESSSVLNYLYITNPADYRFASIEAGQVWRLLTPIFIHFGIMHIVFNMLWTWDLGKLVEMRRGTPFMTLFVLVVGITSNLVQYLLTNNPYFGGMSGVVYGLLGFIWMQGRFNRQFGYELNKQTVVMMLGWFVICWTGLLGPIANWAHSTGLLIGIVWGAVSRSSAVMNETVGEGQ